MLRRAAPSPSCLFLGLLTGSKPRASPAWPQENAPKRLSPWPKLSVSSPHPPLGADSSLCPALPQPTLPSPAFCSLSGGLCFLCPLKPSCGSVAERASRALPAAARALPEPCSEACVRQPRCPPCSGALVLPTQLRPEARSGTLLSHRARAQRLPPAGRHRPRARRDGTSAAALPPPALLQALAKQRSRAAAAGKQRSW